MNSRDKGARNERALAEYLQAHGYSSARRGQQFKGGADSPDIINAIPGIHIECKAVEHLSIVGAVNQAVRDAGPSNIPAVFHKRNGLPGVKAKDAPYTCLGTWLVTLRIDDFLAILRRGHHGTP